MEFISQGEQGHPWHAASQRPSAAPPRASVHTDATSRLEP